MGDRTFGQRTYPTGVQLEVFVEGDERPLDVKNITMLEEGTITPLFNFFDHKARRMGFSTRVVSGNLHFNFNQEHLIRMRQKSEVLVGSDTEFRSRDGFQRLQGVNLIVEMVKIDHRPTARVVKDTLRIEHVWTHPFQHSPDPHANESVSFTAHSMTLIDRRVANVRGDTLADFVRDPQSFSITDGFGPVERHQLAIVDKVIDGDTLDVRLKDTGEELNVRLLAVDTPETPKAGNDVKDNTNQVYYWTWPDTAPPRSPTGTSPDEGGPGRHPTPEQLDRYGCEAKDFVKDWVPENGHVWLVSDAGSAPTDTYGRALYQIYDLRGGSVEEDLLAAGLAYSKNYRTEARVGGLPAAREAQLRKIFEDARQAAGTKDARGIWSSFESSVQLVDDGTGHMTCPD